MTTDVLTTLRDLMADPDEVVRSPGRLYEYDGTNTIERGCFIGNYYRACDVHGAACNAYDFQRTIFPEHSANSWAPGTSATEALRTGREHCVALVDAAIERAGAESRELALV